MSADDDDTGNAADDVGSGRREIAYRLFAAEFDDSTLSYSESDEERAPNYVVTPTGARVNRLFAVGVLTEVEAVNEETRRGRIVDPTGAFVTYAGQYQPDERAFLERADPPAFVALAGKARTFEPEDSDRVFTSVRPESLNAVDARTRDRWIVETAESTLDRLAMFVRALESDLEGEELRVALSAGGAPPGLATGIPKAIETYDTSPAYLEAVRRMAVEALELVAGEREEVTRPSFAPDGRGDGDVAGVEDVGPLPDTDVTVEVDEVTGTDAAETETEGEFETEPDAPEMTDVEEEREITEEPAVTEQPEEPAVTEESEVTAEPDAREAPVETGDLDDFEADDEVDDAPTTEQETQEVDDSGMYELDEQERQEVADEYGTEFATGTEVDEPGEADIDVPDADELAAELEAEAEAGGGSGVSGEETESQGAEEGAGESVGEDLDGDDGVEATDVDLESAAIEAIEALDDGDGADREDVVERVVDEYGADPDAVEDAIQDALMGGLCYEPGDDRLKAI